MASKARSALGWRSHSGWAVLVVVQGTAASPVVLERQRVTLVADDVSRFPYHAIAQGEVEVRSAKSWISRVERAATKAATAATKEAIGRFGVSTVGVVGKLRNVPEDLDRILASHQLLHAAEGALFEQALVEAGRRAGLASALIEVDALKVSRALDDARRILGPPWQKDHKLAAAAALAALEI